MTQTFIAVLRRYAAMIFAAHSWRSFSFFRQGLFGTTGKRRQLATFNDPTTRRSVPYFKILGARVSFFTLST
jgi:hypothetical protein